MRISTIKQADDRLADAFWWLKGFAEARSAVCQIGDAAGESGDLAGKVQAVRSFLTRIDEGRIRRLGEETAIVLTFAEWERICDFLLIDPDSIEQREIACKTARVIHEEYRAQDQEWRNSNNPDLPF